MHHYIHTYIVCIVIYIICTHVHVVYVHVIGMHVCGSDVKTHCATISLPTTVAYFVYHTKPYI